MAEGKEPKGFSFDDDEDEWMSSKVTGFKFEDDDETPFQGEICSSYPAKHRGEAKELLTSFF